MTSSIAPLPDTGPTAVPGAAGESATSNTGGAPTVAAVDVDGAVDPDEVPVPSDQAGIDALRTEIDQIDGELVKLIQRRTALSNAIGSARKSFGGPRIVYSRELAILERFRSLGPAGTDLGMLLLSMGRGRMGRR